MQLDKKAIKAFQEEILGWYAKNKRDLPWRGIPDGISLQERVYRILVSEVMLQQTQVARVIPKYHMWLRSLPSLMSLSKATTSEVLRLWSGLGYNRRALYLHRLAKKLMDEIPDRVRDDKNEIAASSTTPRNDSVVYPTTIKGWKELPGIGEYTARAALCFAFGVQLAVVDTNIRKVILTKFQIANFKYPISSREQPPHPSRQGGTPSPASGEGYKEGKEIQRIADILLPIGRAVEWNQALMDYAAAVLKKEKILQSRTKQKPFKDSDRYYRGRIVKLLLEGVPHVPRVSRVPRGVLKEELRKELGLEEERFEKIVKQMEKDGLLREKEEKIQLF